MIDKKHIAAIGALAGPKGATTDPDIIAPHLVEWRDKYRGQTQLMVMPDKTETLADIVKYCNAHKIAIVPQGGNTGLVGGSLPGLGKCSEILVSLKRMNTVLSVDATDFSVVAEAGTPILDVQKAAQGHDRLFPLSLASEGSCTVGGTISTNAGGVHVGRYGSMRALTLGIEAVLPDGSIFNDLSPLRKNNTGYDLKQLLIGGEGTLGIITKATLKLVPAEVQTHTCWLAVDSPASALNLLSDARAKTGDRVSVIELIPDAGLKLVLKHIAGARNPLSSDSPWYALLEVASSSSDPALSDTVGTMLENWLFKGMITDGAIAQNEIQAKAMWGLRENMSAAQKHEGPSIKHDIAVPVASVPKFLDIAEETINAQYPGVKIIGFGHLGDGNIHYDIMPPAHEQPEDFMAKWESINRFVHDIVNTFEGSISAEHGIGSMKASDLAHYKDPTSLAMMHTIKKVLDPNKIMNPNCLFLNK